MASWRRPAGVVVLGTAMFPLLRSLDLLADRRALAAVLGLVVGALLVAAGARLLVGGSPGGAGK